MLSPLAPSNRCPLANTRQVFQANSATGAFCLFNNPLGDHVVHILRETALFASACLEQPLGRFRTLLLKLGSQFRLAPTQVVDLCTRVGFAITVCGDVDDAQIDTQRIPGLELLMALDLTGCSR